MDVTQFHWLRVLLSSNRLLNRLRAHLRVFNADVLLSILTKCLCQPFKVNGLRTMVIAPHQDDETLGCGGLIALKCQQGLAVQVVFVTDGAHAPLPGDGSLTRHELPGKRLEEACNAARALGVCSSDLHFLDLPDNTLQGLAGAEKETVVKRLAYLMADHQPEEIYVPHQMDGHRDHEATYDLVLEAVGRLEREPRLLQYAIWRPWLQPTFTPACLRELRYALRLPIDAAILEKSQAIKAYVSQVATLPSGFLARFHRPYELFFPATGSVRTLRGSMQLIKVLCWLCIEGGMRSPGIGIYGLV